MLKKDSEMLSDGDLPFLFYRSLKVFMWNQPTSSFSELKTLFEAFSRIC